MACVVSWVMLGFVDWISEHPAIDECGTEISCDNVDLSTCMPVMQDKTPV